MRLSGWLGLAAMAGLTCLFCLSGKLIVHAFDKMPLHRAQTYPALGESTHSTSLFCQQSLHCQCTEACCYCGHHCLMQRACCCAGQLALGKSGRYLVAGFALSEFFGGGCMMLIVMWQTIVDTLPDEGDLIQPLLNTSSSTPHYIMHHPAFHLLAVEPKLSGLGMW